MCAGTWGYRDDNGPSVWARDYPKAAGQRQSPVNIDSGSTKAVKHDHALKADYSPEPKMSCVNNGLTFVATINGDNFISGGPLDTKSYKLASFHFHWGSNDSHGSEHTINSQAYPAELHLVHWNYNKYDTFAEAAAADDGLSVLGVMLKIGEPNAALKQVCDAMEKVTSPATNFVMTSAFDLPGLLPGDINKFYTYPGSLTTPPCHESVTWIVCQETIGCSKEQLSTLRSLKDNDNNRLVNNFRPVMPLGNRTICCSN
ncbi:carbonic anhydrase 2 [Octopus sinensis]|uniref:Carbonic anhydrase n=1 Tax=Octopus sinensis TaxID=2607531 RepID=A0A6P7SJN1_9MOLL|nr:carbonic anhydrase 2 [Octopus sinensis]XP_029638146.1 carbonic anhydrase 2 [Octopus sinensis]